MHLPSAWVVHVSGVACISLKRTPAVPATALLLVLSPPAVKVMSGSLPEAGRRQGGQNREPESGDLGHDRDREHRGPHTAEDFHE